MKTGNAFVSFIDLESTELSKEGRLSADKIALFFRHADMLVRTTSKKSRPDVVESAVDLHRLAWFTDDDSSRMLASIFQFFVGLRDGASRFNQHNQGDDIPEMRFTAGLSEGNLTLDEKTKLFVGPAVNSANACAERARETGNILTVSSSILKRADWRAAIEGALRIHEENEPVPVDAALLLLLASR